MVLYICRLWSCAGYNLHNGKQTDGGGASGREKEGPLGPVREVGKAVVRDKGTGLADIFSLS